MPERPDLRAISGNIRDALGACDRDTLLDILTFVFKEYVVEGPPPLLMHQAERIPDLEGLSFAELISALQTRLDVPELSLFQVDGATVQVRVGGVLQPLVAPRGQAPLPASVSQPAPEPQQAPRPGVQVVETEFVRRPPGATSGQPRRGDLAGAAHAAVDQAMQGQGSAPPPRRGMSLRGRAAGGAMMPQAGAQAPQQPAQPSQPPKDSQPDREPPGDDDGAATRFSLLELD